MKNVIPLLVLSLFLAPGCGKKKATTGGGAASADRVTAQTKIPDDAKSKAFAEKLLTQIVQDFKPSDNSEAQFVYRTVTFQPDNSWQAVAQMTAQGETIDCQELGEWSMDPADDEHTAAMEWKVNKTTCAGRPETGMLRLKVTIEGGEYNIKFR